MIFKILKNFENVQNPLLRNFTFIYLFCHILNMFAYIAIKLNVLSKYVFITK